MLAGLMDRRPTVRQLVVSDWFAFELVEYARELQKDSEWETPPAEQMAAMLATATTSPSSCRKNESPNPFFRIGRNLSLEAYPG